MTGPGGNKREARLVAYVAVGLLAGALYVFFDIVSEARIGRGTLTGSLERAHTLVDHTFPILVGGLLGVSAHYLRLRAKLTAAEEAAARAEGLNMRLQRVERDQAVWVLVATVLHELNNPLHALGLLLDELAATQNDPAASAALIGRARAQADRALAHLKMLRSMRSAGEPDFVSVSLDRVLTELGDEVALLAAGEGFTVDVECAHVNARADATYVRTIVENLVGNSLRSLRGGQGDRISIRIATEGERAVVRVSDNGAPLVVASGDALFEPLNGGKREGLGLGLPIARALARAMRGDLRLEDLGRKTFRLELPLESAE
ncbi:MAG TPA: HAMP domain-containing sensor histidine kinase [Polyangiaceae bacterium]|jgi:signal transduction histidine kinase|nr:HAMP domain-containing sensor histidine kinase [Polyangiaceae bacterium]